MQVETLYSFRLCLEPPTSLSPNLKSTSSLRSRQGIERLPQDAVRPASNYWDELSPSQSGATKHQFRATELHTSQSGTAELPPSQSGAAELSPQPVKRPSSLGPLNSEAAVSNLPLFSRSIVNPDGLPILVSLHILIFGIRTCETEGFLKSLRVKF